MIAAALSAVAVAPAAAHGPGGGGPGRGGDDQLLDSDLTLAGTLGVTSAGKSRTTTVEDRDGNSKTITIKRAVKASGDVTADIKTAAGGDPGALTGAIKFSTRSSSTRSKLDGILTVSSTGGKLRLRVHGRAGGDGVYDVRIGKARGTGDLAGAKVSAEGDLTVTDSAVTLDLDGEYGYPSADEAEGGQAGRGRGGRDCPPRGGQQDEQQPGGSSRR
ncbi:MAG TPA: hypothetical protein VFY44_08055 [Thermoleophilaceae bacterium]|nr:hypothetical protein [Thermoleophilaceae bacterium]